MWNKTWCRLRLQSPSEHINKTQEQLPEKSTDVENKEVKVEAPASKPNVEQNMVPVKVSADVDRKDQIQPVVSANQNTEAAEPPPANKAAEVKEKKTDTNPTNVDYQVSSDLQVKVSVTDTAEVPATPVVVLKPQEEALFTTQPANTSSLEDAGVKVSVQTTDGSSEKALLKETQEEIVPNPLQFMVEELPENTSSPDEDVSFQTSVDSDIHLESVSKSPTQPGNETPAQDSYEKHPLEQDDKKTVKAEAEVETPDVDNATPSEEAPRVNSLQPVTYTLPEPHAAEDVVIAVKYEVDSEEDTKEPVLKKNTEEIVVAEVQSANNAAVEQNVKPSLEDVVDSMDLNIEDALKPILAADSEDVLNGSDYRAIELTDAPDVKTAQKESVPKTEESKKFSQQKLDQQPIDTKVSEEFQKPAEELKSSKVPKIYWGGRPACSYCNKIIDGNIKLILSEPSVVCHPECLKCGVCARILGDLLTRIYLHENVIKCDVCFARALNI
ncbi:hypothetical protein AMECASPLE_001683 [Ameca splendens]|uniref:LIM zinc-binding domain-containing protein n=1 Tax=Ameca splendens TaxID=208324 RepID=A0ABV0Z6Y5_9TELE